MPKHPIRISAFEVKFALNPMNVLGPDGSPTPAVAAALGITDAAAEYRVAFLDGPHLDFHTERWNVRFRDKGGKREVSFKRRLPVYHDSVPGVLATALRQGFDAGEQAEGYTAEVEWGPRRRTLSLLKEGRVSDGWPATAAEAAAIAAREMPGKLRKWMRDDWSATVLAAGHLYGPVRARRWSWSAVPGKTAFEVWDVRAATGSGSEPIVEVSFKADEEAEAAASRAALRALLSNAPGWLLAEDVLKTDLVLDRYR